MIAGPENPDRFAALRAAPLWDVYAAADRIIQRNEMEKAAIEKQKREMEQRRRERRG